MSCLMADSGPKVRTDVSSILIKEDESTVFVPTVITSRLQVRGLLILTMPPVGCGRLFNQPSSPTGCR